MKKLLATIAFAAALLHSGCGPSDVLPSDTGQGSRAPSPRTGFSGPLAPQGGNVSNAGDGVANTVPKWTAGSRLVNGSLTDDGTKVLTPENIGIGSVTTPAGPLDIGINQDATNGGLGIGVIYLRNNFTGQGFAASLGVDNNKNVHLGTTSANTAWQFNTSGGATYLTIDGKSGDTTLTVNSIAQGASGGLGSVSVTADGTNNRVITWRDKTNAATTGVYFADVTHPRIRDFTNAIDILGWTMGSGTLEVFQSLTADGTISLTAATDTVVQDSLVASSGNQNLNINAAGSGLIRFNSNTAGATNSGTGGLALYAGNNGSTPVWTVSGAGTTTIINSTAAGAERIKLLGKDVLGNTDNTNGPMLDLGISISGRREFMLVDSAAEALNGTNIALSFGVGSSINATISAVSTDWSTGKPLTLGGSNITLSTTLTLFQGTGTSYLDATGLDCLYSTNSAATCKLDNAGYADGTTQFRSLEIDDGKGNAIATFEGQATPDLTMQAHKITNLADPTNGQDAVTLAYLNSHAVAGQNYSSDFGPGTDGSVTFDGTSTVLGLTPSSSTYTLTRSIYPSTMNCNDGVRIKENGFQIFVSGTLTGGTTTPCQIDDNGLAATTNSGAAARLTGWYGATAGGGSTQASGSQGQTLGAPFTSGSTQTGGTAGAIAGNGGAGSGVCTGGGGGGQSATNTGAAGGNTAVYAGTSMNPLPLILAQGVGGRTFGTTTLAVGSGGGGGGGAALGGGGGAGGGIAYVNARKLALKLAIQAAGGNGANAISSGGGGGGGGGGGIVWVEYVTNSGTLTTSVAGGTHGTGSGGGGNGGDGAACLVFKLNLSGDGT